MKEFLNCRICNCKIPVKVLPGDIKVLTCSSKCQRHKIETASATEISNVKGKTRMYTILDYHLSNEEIKREESIFAWDEPNLLGY